MNAPQAVMPALCQDCLRIVVIEVAKHGAGDDRACTCGGQVCGCGACMMIYAKLLNGARDAKQLGLLGPDEAFEWTPQGGLEVSPRDTVT